MDQFSPSQMQANFNAASGGMLTMDPLYDGILGYLARPGGPDSWDQDVPVEAASRAMEFHDRLDLMPTLKTLQQRGFLMLADDGKTVRLTANAPAAYEQCVLSIE